VSIPLLAKAYPHACLSMWGFTGNRNLAFTPQRASCFRNPAALIGPPRSASTAFGVFVAGLALVLLTGAANFAGLVWQMLGYETSPTAPGDQYP